MGRQVTHEKIQILDLMKRRDKAQGASSLLNMMILVTFEAQELRKPIQIRTDDRASSNELEKGTKASKPPIIN